MRMTCGKYILAVLLASTTILTGSEQDIPDSEAYYAVLGEDGETYIQPTISSGRVKRTLQDQNELEFIVDKNNYYRGLQNASNMEFMSWDSTLEEMAVLWAENCDWEHGQPSGSWGDAYNSLGQNLYITSGSAISWDNVVGAWYNEIVDYDYDTKSCKEGKACGHYTQIVWDSTSTVGCAWHHCSFVTTINWSNAKLAVCNYNPPGNYRNAYPFLQGPPCTRCESGELWCYDDTFCRSLGTSGGIPQDALVAVVESIQDSINSSLAACCNASLDSVLAAEVEPLENTTTVDSTTAPVVDSGAELPVTLIISVTLLGCLIVVILAVLFGCVYIVGRNPEKGVDYPHYSKRKGNPKVQRLRLYMPTYPGSFVSPPPSYRSRSPTYYSASMVVPPLGRRDSQYRLSSYDSKGIK